MYPRSPGPRLADPQPAAKSVQSHPDAADADTRRSRGVLPSVEIPLYAASIVGDDDVQLATNAPELDGNLRSRGVPVSVRESFLNNAENRSLQAHGKLVALAVGRQLRDQSGAIGKTIDIVLETEE